MKIRSLVFESDVDRWTHSHTPTHTQECMARIIITFLQRFVVNALKEAILETKPYITRARGLCRAECLVQLHSVQPCLQNDRNIHSRARCCGETATPECQQPGVHITHQNSSPCPTGKFTFPWWCKVAINTFSVLEVDSELHAVACLPRFPLGRCQSWFGWCERGKSSCFCQEWKQITKSKSMSIHFTDCVNSMYGPF